ncbi:hypothetical protein ACP3PD_08600 [Enterobacter ludwigii]
MNNTLFRRTVIVWLLACLISGVLLYAEQIRRQFWERDREFSTRYSTLSAVLTQNESVLPLLNGEEDLAALRKKFPHILALEKTSGRALNAARVESTRDCQYWLYNPWRQIRVLIDLAPLLSTQHTFDALAIRFNDANNAPLPGLSGTGSGPSRNPHNLLPLWPRQSRTGWPSPGGYIRSCSSAGRCLSPRPACCSGNGGSASTPNSAHTITSMQGSTPWERSPLGSCMRLTSR